MRKYKVALVGTGGIAAIHADNLARAKDRVELVAACDVDQARLAAFGDEHGIVGRYQDLTQLLAEAKPDIVHLCTPPMLHIDQAIECLEAGVHVLSEKPPALSLADFDRLNTAQAVGGAQFSCVFQHRFGDASTAAQTLIGGSDFGRPLVASCDTLWYRPDSYFDLPWRGSWNAEGGGPTMGHGIHQFDLLLHLLGPGRKSQPLHRGRRAPPQQRTCPPLWSASKTVRWQPSLTRCCLLERPPTFGSTANLPPLSSATSMAIPRTTGQSPRRPAMSPWWPTHGTGSRWNEAADTPLNSWPCTTHWTRASHFLQGLPRRARRWN